MFEQVWKSVENVVNAIVNVLGLEMLIILAILAAFVGVGVGVRAYRVLVQSTPK